jgi:outer membrane protein OmpA-like peptidoglycan-associated protein
MTFSRVPFAAAICGVLALGACTDQVAQSGPGGLDKTQRSAAIGAGIGAVLGAATGRSGDRLEAAIKGAAVGGAAGAGIGYSLDRQEADLRQSIQNDGVGITNTGDRLIVTLPQDITFAVDSFAVRPDLQRDLRAVAGNLQAYPNSVIQIVGHTDSDGEAGYNQTLSERRASAVADILLSSGVPYNRIQTYGRGETQPVASNLTPEGKAQNRRVEIVILPTAT